MSSKTVALVAVDGPSSVAAEGTIAASGINPIYSQTAEKSAKAFAIEEDIYVELIDIVLPKVSPGPRKRDLRDWSRICCFFVVPALVGTCIFLSLALNVLMVTGVLTPALIRQQLQEMRATLEYVTPTGPSPTDPPPSTGNPLFSGPRRPLQVVDYGNCTVARQHTNMTASRLYLLKLKQASLPHFISELGDPAGIGTYSFVYESHNLSSESPALELAPVFISAQLGPLLVRYLQYHVGASFPPHSSGGGVGHLSYIFCPLRHIQVYADLDQT